MPRFVPVLVLMAHAAVSPLSSQEMEDVVYLKDGTRVRGSVVERILGESLTIRGQDGSVATYPMGEVARIVKEPVKGPEEAVEPVEDARAPEDEEAPPPEAEMPAPEAEKAPAPETDETPALETEEAPAPEAEVEPWQAMGPGGPIGGGTHKNPWLAFGLSALIPGTGQFYNEQYEKGIPQLGAAIAGSALVFSAVRDNYEDIYGNWVDADEDDQRAVYGGILWLGGLLWSVIDAPVSANRINRERQRGSEVEGVTLDLDPVLGRNGAGARLVIRY